MTLKTTSEFSQFKEMLLLEAATLESHQDGDTGGETASENPWTTMRPAVWM